MEELAQFACLRGADGALCGQGLVDVAPLAENGQQIGSSLAGMFEQELEPFRRGRIVRRHGVPAAVVLDEKAEEPQEPGFLQGALAALTDKVVQASADSLVLFVVLNDRGHGFQEELFVGGSGHSGI